MSDEKQRERRLTVAQVRTTDKHAEILFYESTRIYRLLCANPAYEALMRRLRAAATTGTPVRVRLSEPNSDVIENVPDDS